MTDLIYKAICSKILKCDSSSNAETCCVCFKNVDDDGVLIDNEIKIILESGVEMYKSLSEVLVDLLGNKFLDVSSVFKTICNQCIDTAVNSYYFVQSSIEKADTLLRSIEKIENAFTEGPESDEVSKYKSLYIFIDDSATCENRIIFQHCDNESHETKNSVLQRIKFISPLNNKTKKDKSIKISLYNKDPDVFNIESLSCVVNDSKINKKGDGTLWKLKGNDKSEIKTQSMHPTIDSEYWFDEDLNNDFYEETLPVNTGDSGSVIKSTVPVDSLESTIKTYFENQPIGTNISTLKKEQLKKFASRLFAHNLKKFKCTKCNAGFETLIRLNKHQQRKGSCAKLKKGTYICDHCGYVAVYKRTLQTHISFKHMNGGIICDICGVAVANESILRVHKVQHTDLRNFECKECGGKYKTATILKNHMMTHSTDMKYECEFCDKKFNTSSKRLTHVRRHHIQQNTVSCQICNTLFKNEMNLYSHMHKKHKQGAEPKFACNHCEYRAHTAQALEKHITFRHMVKNTPEMTPENTESFYIVQYINNLKRYKCKACGRQADCLKKLEEHYNFKHKGERPFSCETCGKTFGTSHILKNHIQNTHGNKIYKCNVCDREYKSLSGLKNHMPVHTGETPYPCEFCETLFATTTLRFEHIMKHHGSELLECDICLKKFKTQDRLDLHKILHEKGEITLGRRKIQYTCNQCDHLFVSKKELEEHISYKHEGQKPFVCDACGKAFGTTRLLKVHSRCHGEKTFNCDLCDKRYKTPLSLKLHMHYHMGEMPYRCKYCDKWFKRPTGRLEHERRHHPEHFSSQLLATIAAKEKERRMRKRRFCDICGYIAKSLKTLQEHVNFKHHGMRPFSCNECGDNFGTERQLKDHLKNHVIKDNQHNQKTLKKKVLLI